MPRGARCPPIALPDAGPTLGDREEALPLVCALKGLGGRLGLLCPRGGGEGGSVGPAWRPVGTQRVWVGVCEPPEGRAGALWAPESHVVCDPLQPLHSGPLQTVPASQGLREVP